ncbi:chloride channel protein [Streptomyces sp. NBC_00210]|uniref:chloride channel protein n=1 Tax=Streptomyces sp. NBC_00210 TaxID=2903636 RepID=UPI00386F88DC
MALSFARPWSACVLVSLAGAAAGGGAVVFRWLIETTTRLLSGRADPALHHGTAHPHAPWLGPYVVLLVPVFGGLLYGPLIARFAKGSRGHGVPDVMLAVDRNGGRIDPAVTGVKAWASAVTIGSGGSVGCVGPIVQIGSALGSLLGRVTGVADGRVRLLVACGAAGGVAATLGTPLAGAIFAMELILGVRSVRAFCATATAGAAGAAIGHVAFGDAPLLSVPPFHADHINQYLLLAALGLAAGVVGTGLTHALYLVEDVCNWAWRGPEWLRPAVGGVPLGLVLLVLPEMYGTGYPVLEKAAEGGYATRFLLLLLAGKVLATSLTLAIGGGGGVFAPTLFVGTTLGAAYGTALNQLLPSTAGAVASYALVGMGTVFAATSGTPFTAAALLFELTGQFSIVPPLAAGIALALLTARLLSRDTIYTLKLRRQGVDLATWSRRCAYGAGVSARTPPVLTLPASTEVIEAARLLRLSPHGALPVLDAHGRCLGMLTARAAADALAHLDSSTDTAPLTAGDLAGRDAESAG